MKILQTRTVRLAVILLLGACVLASSSKELSTAELEARADAAKPDDRPGLYVEIMERQLKAASQLYSPGKMADAREAIHDISVYADKAHDAALVSQRRLKSTEISMRRIASRLHDLKSTLNFEDQAPVQAAVDHIEQLRADLLTHMFSKS